MDIAGRKRKQGIGLFIPLSIFLSVMFSCSLFLLPTPDHPRQPGLKFIENFTPDDYGGALYNWQIAQDRHGLIYVANQEALLVYDGVTWQKLYITGPSRNSPAYSLAINAAGTLYIGGFNQIGFTAPGPNGELTYMSLLNKLPEADRQFSTLWNTHAASHGVYFQSKTHLFRLRDNRFKTWRPKADQIFNNSFLCNDTVYIRQKGTGLLELKGDTLHPVPGGELFGDKDKPIFMLVPYDDRRLLIGTQANGIFLYDGRQALPFPTEADDFFRKNNIYHGIRLSGSPPRFAVATLRGGLVILDAQGRITGRFDEDTGLQDNGVKFVFQDTHGNLWLALGSGISKIEYAVPITTHDKRTGLKGMVYSATRHGPEQSLYAGTSRGLYVLGPSSRTFQKVPGMTFNCWGLLSTRGTLLAATTNGVAQVRPGAPPPITDLTCYTMLRSRKNNQRIWVGSEQGLHSMIRRKGQWREEHRFKEILKKIRSIAEDTAGNLWLTTETGGEVMKVSLPATGVRTCRVSTFTTVNDLPLTWVKVFRGGGGPVFFTNKGLFRFHEQSRTFQPSQDLGAKYAGGPEGRYVFFLTEDANRDIWFYGEGGNSLARPRSSGTYEIIEGPFRRLPRFQYNVIYPDPGSHCVWFGGSGGLTCFDKNAHWDPPREFNVLVRRVTANQETIFHGAPGGRHAGKGEDGYVFPYSVRHFRFEYVATYYIAEGATTYRYRLDGLDGRWSPWERQTRQVFPGLDAGTYIFRVQAKNVYGDVSREDRFQFEIEPPWYRTAWAYILYGLLFVLLLYRAITWKSSRLEREKKRLEHIVKARTHEIEEKNNQLESQTRQLQEQSGKLKELDKAKSRFFANISHEFRTPLTLIMSPLEQMLAQQRNPVEHKALSLMQRNSQRLLGLINQLLELSRFESGAMKLQASPHQVLPFLEGIVTSFEAVATRNELDLTFEAPREELPLYFDPDKLEEVFFNLLSNAVKFTPPGGKITVTAEVSPQKEENFPGGSLAISVSDTGPGIPPEQLAHVFDRFYQSEATYEHHQKGTGIGLSIARELVELHHGKLDVHSHVGKGTEFIIRLPLGKFHLKPGEIVETAVSPVQPKAPPDIAPLQPPPASGPVPEAEPGPKPPAPQKEMILVVDDSAEMRLYIRQSLENTYAVLEAENGGEGVEKALELIPDLIISDVMMPVLDGFQLCGQLKNDVRTSHIPIILLTARAAEENILQGLETGADDYITKPFSTKILCARVKNLIDLRGLMQQALDREMTLKPSGMRLSSIDKGFFKKLRKILKENIPDPEFNIEQLCKKMEMSQPTLYRKIHALSGESPTEFIRSFRLMRAAELLKSSSCTVLEIAFEVGFGSAAYFTKCFKKKFQQLPSSFQTSESR